MNVNLFPGQIVTILPAYATPKFTGYARIERVNPKTITIKLVSGKQYRCSPSMVQRVTDTALRAEAQDQFLRAEREAETGDVPPLLHRGTLVRVKGVRQVDPSNVYVVHDDKGAIVNLNRLGGVDGLRYLRIPRGYLEVIDVDRVKIEGLS